jgi:hypothetical protein
MDPRLASLVAAVRVAVEDSERELRDMPFLIRPMVRRGFTSRTGRTYDEWKAALANVDAALIPALESLADNFATAPERARRGPAGSSAQAMKLIEERSAARADAVRALIAALVQR